MAARVDPQRSAIAPVPPDAEGCAAGRQRFLTADSPEPGQVRPAILASWRRSREAGLAADRLQVPFLRDPDAETPLTRSAGPVLSRLSERLSGLAVSIILTDPAGTVLSRRTLDREFERQLDRVLLAPGFSYAERFAGTNGIGTALETGAATQVFGHEHYAENLERLACAAAPIHDPVSGRMAGVLDLTCWRKDTDALLLTLAETTAEQIQQAMLMAAGRAEAAVLQAYRQACRRTAGIVLAVTADAVTFNDRARAELAPGDQAAVVAHAVEIGRALAPGHRRHVDVPLPAGVAARLHCHQIDDAGRAAGLVVHVRVGEQGTLAAPHDARPPARPPLRELVGGSPLWRRACEQAYDLTAAGAWVALHGEPGTGKRSLAQALAHRFGNGGRAALLDARDARADPTWVAEVRRTLDAADRVVLTHVDALTVVELRTLDAVLRQDAGTARATRLWVAVTLGTGQRPAALDRLLERFGGLVETPPLRLRPEDVPALAAHFARPKSSHPDVAFTSAALGVLQRASWPGNVEQLRRAVRTALTRRRRGAVDVADLPADVPAGSRRLLSPIESLERDAIVQSLDAANGNKLEAARALGLSRATIYRRIREYGIVTS